MCAPAKQRIDRLQQSITGTPIGAKPVSLAQCSPSTQVRENIGAAKTVDGLFWITDQKRWQRAINKNALENVVLHGIGVLKLVDQCRLVVGAQRFCQRIPLTGFQGALQSR